MKTVSFFTSVIALTVLAFGASTASAAFIANGSELGFAGLFAPTGGSGLGDATGLSFPGPVSVISGSGDFAGQLGSTATFTDFSFGSLPVDPLFTTDAGLSFTLTSLTIDLQTGSALDWSGTGTYSLAGFDDTPGNFVMTGDALAGLFTFSAAGSAAIPLPGALVLFGSALALLGFRRKIA